MPVIVGSPRSGTTLLRLMLDAHPSLAIPPETSFLPTVAALPREGDDARRRFFETVTHFPPEAPAWHDFHISAQHLQESLENIRPFSTTEGCRAFYRLYAQGKEKPRWGEKTPMYCLHLTAIADLLPEAHFIHIIRDGRDVAASLREQWFAPGKDMETLARHWCDCVATARKQSTACKHYLEVRYEELIRDPQRVLAEICRFIDLPFHIQMLQYHHHAATRLEEHLTRRRTDGSIVVSHEQRMIQQRMSICPPDASLIGSSAVRLTRQEIEEFENSSRAMLRELGYE